MEQHTPGPWTLKHVGGSNFAVQEFEIRGMLGDKPNVYPIFNKRRNEIDGGTIYTSPANARLIAAAPELLEVLEDWLLIATATGGGDSVIGNRVRAAIRKARGS